MIKYSFHKKVIFDKDRFIIKVEPPFEMLNDLCSGHLSESHNVQNEINAIQEVVLGKRKIHEFGGSDYCILECSKQLSKIFYDFGEKESSVSTKDLIELLMDWKKYLEGHGRKDSREM